MRKRIKYKIETKISQFDLKISNISSCIQPFNDVTYKIANRKRTLFATLDASLTFIPKIKTVLSSLTKTSKPRFLKCSRSNGIIQSALLFAVFINYTRFHLRKLGSRKHEKPKEKTRAEIATRRCFFRALFVP